MALEETTLADLRSLARAFSDMTHSDFVTDDELNRYVNLGVRQLYNKFVEVHGQEYFLRTAHIPLSPPKTLYELPDDLVGVKGVDWSVSEPPETSTSVTEGEFPTAVTTTTAYEVPLERSADAVELTPYTFGNRHEGSCRTYGRGYGGSRPKYRILASKKTVTVASIEDSVDTESRVNLIRLSSDAPGHLLVWYWPEVPRLMADTDSMPMFHGFEEYPAIVAAIMMLSKEESDTTALQIRRKEVEKYIALIGSQRDQGEPEPIRDVEGR